MADNELLIKINADAKNAKKAFDDVKAQTEDLEGQLSGIAKASAIAFAALSAEVFVSIHAFGEAEKATKELTLALQNQGIYTEELEKSYKGYAEAVSEATGIDDDAVTSAQAVAQSYLGNIEVTEELSFAIADLSEKMGGDLNGAAEKIAKTIATGTNAFARQGLVLSDNLSTNERYEKTLAFIETRYGGLAAEANKGVGSVRGLTTAFGNFQENIGAKFAPIFENVVGALTRFFNLLSRSDAASTFVASMVAAGAAVAGVLTVVPAVINAFIALKAAIAGIAVVGAIGIGPILVGVALLAGAVTALALNWKEVTAAMSAVAVAFANNITNLFSGVGKILLGAFSLSPSLVKDGLASVQAAIVSAKDDAVKTYKEETAAQEAEIKKQDEAKAEQAAREQAERKRVNDLAVAIQKEQLAILSADLQKASKESIDLENQRLQTLQALKASQNQQEIVLLTAKLEEIDRLSKEQEDKDLERVIEFQQTLSDVKTEFAGQGLSVNAEFDELELQQQIQKYQTEGQIQKTFLANAIAEKNRHRLEDLENEKKHGKAFSDVQKFYRDSGIQGFKENSNELLALQNSKNKEVKAIGKAAALTQIAIETPPGALKAYSALAGIPIIGPTLGALAAAAVVAYGAERAAEVTAAAQGGLIQGGIKGVDSVPVLAQQGELIAPAQNFEEVVSGVQLIRQVKNGEAPLLSGGGSESGSASIQISLKDNLVEFIEMQILERQRLGISLLPA